jgi:hypothetical protein
MQASSREASVDELRTQAEGTRARLTGTVDELRTQVADTATDLKERLSPGAIKNEVTEYVRESRAQLWHKLEKKARDNPLQAVAVGAALAYPAIQLVRAMPAPLLLIGAGLLLSGSAGGKNGAGAGEALQTHARKTLDAAGQQVEGVADSARQALHDVQDYAQQGLDTAKEATSSATAAIKDQLTAAADTVSATVGDTASRVAGQAEGLAQQTRAAVSSTWEQNPLLVAGIGLAIGAFIAAAFPATETEENLFGESSDALRQKAEEVAGQGVAAAKAAVETAAGTANAQGLSVAGLTSLGESLTEKARAVAERGLEAALGETKPANS